MRTHQKWLVAALCIGVAGALLSGRGTHDRGPGVLAPDIPHQSELAGPAPVLPDIAGMQLTPKARFAITARVLSSETYRFDPLASLVPVDLALGWGRMSDSDVLKDVAISQSNRFYWWKVKEFPIPQREIIESSANMHLIPADAGVDRLIRRARTGDVVRFEGFLVSVTDGKGGHWTSSMTRADSGAGACELIYVESFSIEPPGA
ncbi:hypothetical protein [Tahibacter amnicola]|uniref:Uncharacterized protein n=1 Tax=Tahibacter amnicola TaxID=2976241 RepID=A0ABY6BC65_9GAMM|nr:hypothetical protein [Tahibacter amnicola]UXI67643.1 hypothetical protein N4264_23355 [Tahibacter amnicola]